MHVKPSFVCSDLRSRNKIFLSHFQKTHCSLFLNYMSLYIGKRRTPNLNPEQSQNPTAVAIAVTLSQQLWSLQNSSLKFPPELWKYSFSNWGHLKLVNKGIPVPHSKNSSALLVKFTCETSLSCTEQRSTSKGKMTWSSWLILKVSNWGTTPVQSFHWIHLNRLNQLELLRNQGVFWEL